MPPAIVRREIAPRNRIRGSSDERTAHVVAANDNAPAHALWRKIVAASIGALFALALVLVGLACTAHAAGLDRHSLHSSGHP